jgi:predicted amidohydrolase
MSANDGPDLIALPESFNGLGLNSEEWANCAEEVTGPSAEMVSSKASEHSTYIICPIVRRDTKGIHNSAILFDREGEQVGTYDKVHPTIGEIEQGIIPGTEGLVLDTDFGRVGFAICFDLNFRDIREHYLENRPDIVVFPSMYRGGIQLRLWAYEIGCYMMSSTPGELSAIVNPLGRILIESYNYNKIITSEVNLDFQVLHLDYNSTKFDEIKNKYGSRVEIEVASPEGIFLLYSKDSGITSGDLIEEFSLETLEHYFDRASRIRQEHVTAPDDQI